MWQPGDWSYIQSHYCSGHWIGANIEWWYSECVIASNRSATVDFEAMVGREPFIADDVKPDGSTVRQRERLAVGFFFRWKNQMVTVNSFAKDGSYLNATTYFSENQMCDSLTPNRRGVKRFKITRQAIIDDRAERKERAEIESKLTDFAIQADRTQPEAKMVAKILKSLGVKKRCELASMPIEKLRSVAEKYLGKQTKEKK